MRQSISGHAVGEREHVGVSPRRLFRGGGLLGGRTACGRTLAASGLLVAMAGGAVSVLGTSAGASSLRDAPAQSGSTLTVGVAQFPPSLGNPWAGIGSPGIYEWSAIYDTLTTAITGGKVLPDLATSWSNTNATTWIFHLRSGVSFSDGEPFDASAAAATLDYLKSPKGSTNIIASELGEVASATAVGVTTLKITTSGPDAILPNQLSAVYIAAPKVIAKGGATALATDPIGTGPYRSKSWTQDTATLVAVPTSWRAPKVGTLVFQALPDPTARLQALESGEVQVAIGLSVQQIPQIKANDLADVTPSSNALAFAFVNTGKTPSPIDNVLVRQALNYGVNKAAMVKSLFDNLTTASGQPSNAIGYGYDPRVGPYPYDPTLAKQLLAKAGYAHGLKLSAEVVVGSFPEDTQMFEAAAEDLANIGVTFTLQQVQFTTWLSNYLADTWPGAAFSEGVDTYPELQATRPMLYLSCLQVPKPFFCDESLVPMLEKVNTIFNPAQRLAMLYKLDVAYHNDAPVLYLCNEIELNGVSKSLQNYTQGSNFIIDWNDITIGS